MTSKNTISRRDFIEAVSAIGVVGLSSCAANSRQESRLWAADRTSGKLPPRGEFVVRNAYVVTMDPKLGDMPVADVHVRNGAIIAVGAKLSAPGGPY
jgi:5-methylthioadenosine/S-adenosylhomocysteine deaminase